MDWLRFPTILPSLYSSFHLLTFSAFLAKYVYSPIELQLQFYTSKFTPRPLPLTLTPTNYPSSSIQYCFLYFSTLRTESHEKYLVNLSSLKHWRNFRYQRASDNRNITFVLELFRRLSLIFHINLSADPDSSVYQLFPQIYDNIWRTRLLRLCLQTRMW